MTESADHGDFAEYRSVTVTEPLRQGDVLESTHASASMWQRYLLVITADCDFAYDKHMGRVTCVPLVDADDYLAEIQIPRMRDKYVGKRIEALKKILKSAGSPTISNLRLREWVAEEEPSSIVASLALVGENAAVVLAALESIRLLDSPTSTLRGAIDNLVDANLLGPGSPARSSALRTITDRLRNIYSQPPGDALFLSAIGPDRDGGYFAYLRHLEQIWESDIGLVFARKNVEYRRISRMRDRFIHALLQRFGMVFMAIGLPKEYEDMRDFYSDLMVDGLQ